jgi:hypothetical protein
VDRLGHEEPIRPPVALQTEYIPDLFPARANLK